MFSDLWQTSNGRISVEGTFGRGQTQEDGSQKETRGAENCSRKRNKSRRAVELTS